MKFNRYFSSSSMGISSPTTSFLFIFIIALSSLRSVSSSSNSASSLLEPSNLFLYPLQSQCPFSISPTPRILSRKRFGPQTSLASHIIDPWSHLWLFLTVDGDVLDQMLTSNTRIGYACFLFYASWCQFSRNLLPLFETLSSMFPQIEHVMVEQSSAMPSVLSRYGIRSFPSILIVNQTTTLQYRGPKSFLSLVQFYKRTTGLEPVPYYDDGQLVACGRENSIIEKFSIKSVKAMLWRDPYLALSVIFLSLKMALFLLPRALSLLKAFWFLCSPLLNLEIFGERSYILRRILDTVDVRRVWAKLRLTKNRNFREGARNARYWTSLALGESSSRSN